MTRDEFEKESEDYLEYIYEFIANSNNEYDCYKSFCKVEKDSDLRKAFLQVLYNYHGIKKAHAWRTTSLGKELK